MKGFGRLITLIHRQETMSLLGFPLVKYIDLQDSEALLRAIRRILADVARKAMDQLRSAANALLGDKIPPHQLDEVAHQLSAGRG